MALNSLPAGAGDWNNGAGSLKERGIAAVPVPAPAASYDGPSGWYIRLDVGLGRESKRGGKESGLVYGAGDSLDSSSATGAGFGSSASWIQDDSDLNFSYGGGVGYRWTSNWRSDATLEHRTASDYKMRGSYQYANLVATPPGPPAYAPPGAPSRIDGTTSDTTTMRSGVLMANTYYDWTNRSAFTPYVGAGFGLAYLDLSRQHITSDTSCDPAEFPVPCATRTAHRSFSGSGSNEKLLWAGALTAGFSYAITPITSIDVNYRVLYIPTSSVGVAMTNGQESRFSYNDIFEHQIRAGLRWDIN